MVGKNNKKRKAGKIILLGMSFLLTIVLTFTITVAWFYSSDWASNYVTMAGTVGIEIRDNPTQDNPLGVKTSGPGNLHFLITTDKAYPGQAIDVSASVYNNGGKSANFDPVTNPNKGSDCYLRAHFAVYTNIGTGEGEDGESELNPQSLYSFLNGLIDKQNELNAGYKWVYYTHNGSTGLSQSGTSTSDIANYFEGSITDGNAVVSTPDKGYYYLCEQDASSKVLKKLTVGSNAVFLWNDTFIIPWTLTNLSADKYIFVGVTFQAVQTFIPKINNGLINTDPDNQLPAAQCEYDNISVQTVFNSCHFDPMSTIIQIDGVDVDFSQFSGQTVPPPTT